ncbi:hypothetical protein R2F61_04820 [Mollicutes bacterium LVI A0078]|nr:hypothetical protein RZE84_04840 [Mollicutes bacterium LVI A0075]WOO90050.1 hypothetical protein R2F61_04820 [Mollicutes bacterium LVI A0078]
MKNKRISIILKGVAYSYPLIIAVLFLVSISRDYLSDLVYSYQLNIYFPSKLVVLLYLIIFVLHIVKMAVTTSEESVTRSLLLSELCMTLILNKLLLIQLTGLIIEQYKFNRIAPSILGIINAFSLALMLVGIILLFVMIGIAIIKLIPKIKEALKKPQINLGPVGVPVPTVDMSKQSILPALLVTLIVFGLLFYAAYDLYQITQDNRWQPPTETSE